MNTVPVRIDLPLFTEGNIWNVLCLFIGHKWANITGGFIEGHTCSRCKRSELRFVRPK
jgi:hypothetical protein